MIITPTDQGSGLAGVGLWSLLWSILLKLDKIPILRTFINKESVISWIMLNKSLSLILTETINLAMHGVSNPAGMMFTLGGTLVNSFMIFVGLPVRQRYMSPTEKQRYLKQGAA